MTHNYYGYTYAGLAEAFNIFHQYISSPYDLVSEHEQIYAGDHYPMEGSHVERLIELGWTYDTDVERWKHGA